MTQANAIMSRISQGIDLDQRGEREAARRWFGSLWSELEPDGDPLHRCAVAHFLADVHDDVHEELAWDLRALEAAASVSDIELRLAGMTISVRSLYPSLHLNLGDAYRRLGEVDRARKHLERGYAAVEALTDDGYGRMIKGGLDRLAARLKAN